MRGKRLAALSKEKQEEMTADGRTDVDLAALRRTKIELETKVKDQIIFPFVFSLTKTQR
jgi:hypothetical protein